MQTDFQADQSRVAGKLFECHPKDHLLRATARGNHRDANRTAMISGRGFAAFMIQ